MFVDVAVVVVVVILNMCDKIIHLLPTLTHEPNTYSHKNNPWLDKHIAYAYVYIA